MESLDLKTLVFHLENLFEKLGSKNFLGKLVSKTLVFYLWNLFGKLVSKTLVFYLENLFGKLGSKNIGVLPVELVWKAWI